MSKLDAKMRALDLMSELLKKRDAFYSVWARSQRSIVLENRDSPMRSVGLFTRRMQLSDGGTTLHPPEPYDREKALAWLRGE